MNDTIDQLNQEIQAVQHDASFLQERLEKEQATLDLAVTVQKEGGERAEGADEMVTKYEAQITTTKAMIEAKAAELEDLQAKTLASRGTYAEAEQSQEEITASLRANEIKMVTIMMELDSLVPKVEGARHSFDIETQEWQAATNQARKEQEEATGALQLLKLRQKSAVSKRSATVTHIQSAINSSLSLPRAVKICWNAGRSAEGRAP